jgi:preprotein translocase subunit SecE
MRLKGALESAGASRLDLARFGPMAASSQVETLTSGAEKLRLAAVAVLVLLSLVAFYALGKQGAWAQWGALVLCLVAAVVVFFTAEAGKSLVAFGQDAWREVKKVVWPERKEAMQITAYVFGFVVIMALFLWLTDKTLEWLLYDLILGWKK